MISFTNDESQTIWVEKIRRRSVAQKIDWNGCLQSLQGNREIMCMQSKKKELVVKLEKNM